MDVEKAMFIFKCVGLILLLALFDAAVIFVVFAVGELTRQLGELWKI